MVGSRVGPERPGAGRRGAPIVPAAREGVQRRRYDGAVAPRVTLFGRQGCHLCDDARDVIVRVAERHALVLEEVDIDGDPELRSEYDTEVPVVEIDGREVSRYRITEDQLVRALAPR